MSDLDLSPASSKDMLDPLTGAYARPAFQLLLEQEFQRARRYGGSFAFCILDLDFFKSINDAYGHARGDQILRDLAQRLDQELRQSDALCRFGGDEFVLLLPAITKDSALLVAQRFLRSLRDQPFPGNPPLSLSCSIGIAAYPADAASLEGLFETADRRCYEAKRRGRARAVTDDVHTSHTLAFDSISRLIERDEQIKASHDFMSALKLHQNGILRICGLPGSGRTRLLTTCIEGARLRNCAVVALQLQRSGTGPAAISMTEHSLPLKLPLEPEGPELSATLAAALVERHQNTLIVAVDNLALLDADLLRTLRQLLESSRIPHVGLLYTSELNGLSPIPETASSLSEVIETKPLSLDGLRIWMRLLLHQEPAREFLEWLHQETEGLPGVVQHALLLLIEQDILKQDAQQRWLLDEGYRTIGLGRWRSVSRAPATHNLPPRTGDFLGREREIEQGLRLLQTNRLVTLVGAGGIGKTRLALELASQVLDHFRHGVFFCELASVVDAEQVAVTIAQTLAITNTTASSIESLKEFLQGRQSLLVLDNFEHLMGAASLVSELLACAPGLKLLITSRELLSLPGEQRLQVPPLSLPEPDALLSVGDLLAYDGIRLLLRSVRAFSPDFALTPQNAQVLVEICRRLDGLPLALQLASARLRIFTPEELLRRLDSRLKLLTSKSSALPGRQQTMRATIEWSFKLLSAEEQRLLLRLGIFVGGATFRAIEEICGEADGLDLIETLQSLIDKSLLKAESPLGDTRYSMLELVREYATELLEQSAEAPGLRDRHARYYAQYAEQVSRYLASSQQASWIRTLKNEYGNIRAAIEYFFQAQIPAMVIQIYQSIWRFLWQFVDAAELLRRIEAILQLGHMLSPEIRIKAFFFKGLLVHISTQDITRAKLCLDESLVLARQLDDPWVTVRVLYHLAMILMDQGDMAQAQRFCREGLALAKSSGDDDMLNELITSLGIAALREGNVLEARRFFLESLSIAQKQNNRLEIGYSMTAMGWVSRYEGDYCQARDLLEKGLRYFRELNYRPHIMGSLCDLAPVLLYLGDTAQARAYLVESIRLAAERDFKRVIILSLERLGEVEAIAHRAHRAAQLWGAVAHLRQLFGYAPLPDEQERYAQLYQQTREQLGSTAWEAAWNAGHMLTLEEAIAFGCQPAEPA